MVRRDQARRRRRERSGRERRRCCIWDSSAGTARSPQRSTGTARTQAATPLAGGKFTATLSLSYVKGDAVTVSTPAFLVNPKAPALGVKLTPKYFSPDNDGIDDELFINLSAESLSNFTEWSFEIREPEGTSGNVFWKTGGTGKITDRIIWDGRSLKGELVQAATDYPFTFTVKDDVGMTSVVRGYIPVDVMVIRDGDKFKIAVPSIIFRENKADFIGLPAGHDRQEHAGAQAHRRNPEQVQGIQGRGRRPREQRDRHAERGRNRAHSAFAGARRSHQGLPRRERSLGRTGSPPSAWAARAPSFPGATTTTGGKTAASSSS